MKKCEATIRNLIWWICKSFRSSKKYHLVNAVIEIETKAWRNTMIVTQQ